MRIIRTITNLKGSMEIFLSQYSIANGFDTILTIVIEFVIGASSCGGYERGEFVKKRERDEQKQDMR